MLVLEVALRKHSHGVLGFRLEFQTDTFLQLPFRVKMSIGPYQFELKGNKS
jgi:hypothetical protein